MSDSQRDLPHGTPSQAQSDFSPTETIYFTENNQSVLSSTPVPHSPSEMPLDLAMPMPSDLALNSMEHISSLELALCSNFTCCSIQLPDLHALVEHFEEQHVVVFNLDGMRIYPENSGKRLAHFPPPPSLSHSPSSSCSSSAVSSPQTPTTPLFASVITGPDMITQQKSKTLTPSCQHAYTPFNPSTMPETEYGIGLFDDDLQIGPDPYPILINSLIDNYPSHSPESTQKSCSSATPNSKSHDPMEVLDWVDSISVPPSLNNFGDGELVPAATVGRATITSHRDRQQQKSNSSPNGRERERERERLEKKSRSVKADIVNATAVSAKNAVKAKTRITGGNGKRREKAYRCPTPGCTKSYLNPNGLKYHVEKGTCRFEDSTDSEAFTENSRGTAPVGCANTTPPAVPAATTPSLYSSPLVTNTNTLTPRGVPPLLQPLSRTVGDSLAGMSIPTPPATPGSLSPATTVSRLPAATMTATAQTPTPTHFATSTSSC
ncbi:hypothetical protein D9756_003610 [Leucocoprinus leucothites]|uniref:C2H2-type domain-containing protein n=1 Tax=Leucocoprinus leucothites TaxID=201217 RepID=A0A8H5LJU6_9AGAR|nr:hypothetical protein D9756_003610 [Leucoagaricus leucothites]